jgi:hypothetical protein
LGSEFASAVRGQVVPVSFSTTGPDRVTLGVPVSRDGDLICGMGTSLWRGQGANMKCLYGGWRPAPEARLLLTCMCYERLPQYRVGTGEAGGLSGAVTVSPLATSGLRPAAGGKSRFTYLASVNLNFSWVGREESGREVVGMGEFLFVALWAEPSCSLGDPRRACRQLCSFPTVPLPPVSDLS